LLLCEAGHAQETVPNADALEASGALIGAIVIDPQNIFDLNDPQENKRLFRIANRLHIKTHASVIREQLLFHSGDKYSQRALDESERVLRSARYLYDASIRPIAYHDGVVDVAVTTRDVWTLNPGISFGRKGGKNTGGFELEELNILGTGTSLSLSHKTEIDRDTNLFEYKNPHVAGSWVSLDASYANSSDGSTRALTVNRPFYSLTTPWAFGVSGLDNDRIDSLYDLGEVVDKFEHHERAATVYGGWSRGLVDGWTTRWTVGASYENSTFTDAANWSGPVVMPADRKFVYPWVGVDIVEDDFVKERNRDQIGRTEDFHLGTHVRARLGWASTSFGSAVNAWIVAVDASRGVPFGAASTLLMSSSLSTRVEGSELHNALLEGAVRYYLQQSKKALFFATISAASGERLDIDNQILLGGDNGLRGYPLRYQTGSSRALLTIEQRYFTNWYPFRLFRVGAAAFIDVGRTWGTSAVGADNLGLLKDVGIGLRFGSTRSGLGNIIHVDLAFPLDGDPSISNVQFLVETKTSF
jgi:outer membrane protein assembly factor BamA